CFEKAETARLRLRILVTSIGDDVRFQAAAQPLQLTVDVEDRPGDLRAGEDRPLDGIIGLPSVAEVAFLGTIAEIGRGTEGRQGPTDYDESQGDREQYARPEPGDFMGPIHGATHRMLPYPRFPR